MKVTDTAEAPPFSMSVTFLTGRAPPREERLAAARTITGARARVLEAA